VQCPPHWDGDERKMAPSSGDSKETSFEFPHILGIPLKSMSGITRFFTLVSGVMFFYLLYGYIQEWIFRIEGFKPYGWYLTLIQFGYYSLFGVVQMAIEGSYQRR
jgi:adenosine 3'-phospho 5'-phosphosulfate transporter B3